MSQKGLKRAKEIYVFYVSKSCFFLISQDESNFC